MKKVAVLMVAVVSLALAASAVAGSKTISQTGQIVGDKGTSLKLRVKVKNGSAIKLSGFKAQGVKTRCNGVIKRYEYTALSPFPVVDDKFDLTLGDDSSNLELEIKGTVKKGGQATVGSLKTNEFDVDGTKCKVAEQKFKTAK